MMKKFLLVLVLISTAMLSFSQHNSYKGYTWGTPYEEMSDQLKPSSNKIPGFKTYEMEGEELVYEGFQVHLISYAFKKGLFHGVNIGAYTKDKDGILAAMTKIYGEPTVKETPFFVNYEWYFDDTTVALSYLPMKEGDKSISISIGKKK
jgi:hypothetical protein